MSAKSSPDGIVKPDRELDEVRKASSRRLAAAATSCSSISRPQQRRTHSRHVATSAGARASRGNGGGQRGEVPNADDSTGVRGVNDCRRRGCGPAYRRPPPSRAHGLWRLNVITSLALGSATITRPTRVHCWSL